MKSGPNELSDELHAKIRTLCESGDQLVDSEEYDQALAKYREALALLPEPANQWEAATWILTAVGETLFFKHDYEGAQQTLRQAMRCPDAIGNALIHLRLGQAEFELGNFDRAKDELARAYMGGGDKVFESEDPKYSSFIKLFLRPPEPHH
jgi:tetratricopeptide (TPR) repeat protein